MIPGNEVPETSLADTPAEEGFLGCLLRDCDLLSKVADVRPEHFSSGIESKRGLLYQVMLDVAQEEGSFTPESLVRWIIANKLLSKMCVQDDDKLLLADLRALDRPDLIKVNKAVRRYADAVLRAARVRESSTLLVQAGVAMAKGRLEDSHRLMLASIKASQNGHGALQYESLTTLLAKPEEPIPWLIEGLLAHQDLMLLSGTSGVGKSWLLYQLGLAAACGLPVWGHWRVPRPLRVALLDLECPPWIIPMRFRRLWAGLSPELALPIPENFLFIKERLFLDDAPRVAALSQSLQKHGTELLLVDSFRRTFRGSENDSSTISGIFTVLDRLRYDCGCAPVMNDHTRKLSTEPEMNTPAQLLRGSSDKRAMVDVHVAIRKHESGSLEITHDKGRGVQEEPPFLVTIEGLEDDDPTEPVSVTFGGSAEAPARSIEDSIMTALPATAGVWMPRAELVALLPFSERGIRKAMGALLQAGRVRKKTVHKVVSYARIRSLE